MTGTKKFKLYINGQEEEPIEKVVLHKTISHKEIEKRIKEVQKEPKEK